GALDPDTREEMQLLLLELWEEYQMNVFFVTHDLDEAAYLGTRILVLSQYYSDGRGNGPHVNRGAKIVADHQLKQIAKGVHIKRTAEFGTLLQQIREEGFDPALLQHVTQFNLRHPDSYQTLTKEELSN
ncbi:MAG TPA: ABC transporter ATP-binding protein, partial [Gammaproteobacteria bacterium]|nr:ABC transporter ATP-binding protein [Gammaproteobacteria bacterium]